MILHKCDWCGQVAEIPPLRTLENGLLLGWFVVGNYLVCKECSQEHILRRIAQVREPGGVPRPLKTQEKLLGEGQP